MMKLWRANAKIMALIIQENIVRIRLFGRVRGTKRSGSSSSLVLTSEYSSLLCLGMNGSEEPDVEGLWKSQYRLFIV